MAVKINTQTGMIEISNDVIATVVGGAVTDVFGIVGMASKNQIKDNITEILRKKIIHAASLYVKKRTESQLMSIRSSAMARRSQKYRAMSKKK